MFEKRWVDSTNAISATNLTSVERVIFSATASFETSRQRAGGSTTRLFS